MRKIIHNIRKQPEEIRRHILHILISFCAIVLFFLWIYSLGTTLTNTDNQEKIGEDLKPFSTLKDNVVDGINNLNEPDSNTVVQ